MLLQPCKIRGSVVYLYSQVGSGFYDANLRMASPRWCLFGSRLNSASGADVPDPNYPAVQFSKTPRTVSRQGDFGPVAKIDCLIKADPFNPVGTLIFLAAIVHTFLTSRFMQISHRYQQEFAALENQEKESDHAISRRRDVLQFRAQFFHFMGEVEAVFGIWLVPLFILIVLMKGWPTLVDSTLPV